MDHAETVVRATLRVAIGRVAGASPAWRQSA